MNPSHPLQIVIVGSGGMLGTTLSEILGAEHPQTVCATRDEIDITDPWRTRWELERLGAEVVVNCAAYTDVDECETQTKRAWQVNGEGAGNLARSAHEIGARIIHLSTDYVFDGAKQEPYREEDPAQPLSEYGRSKQEGDRQVVAANPDHLIVRCAWLYGPGGSHFLSSVLGAARNGGPVRVVTDQWGTPTYTIDLARAILRLVSLDTRGVIHFANSGVCSRYELAEEALVLAGLGTEGLVPITTADVTDRPASRPRYSALDTGKYTDLTGVLPRPWQETVRDYIEATG